MLSDIITLILGLALILFGIQSMMLKEVRGTPADVVKAVTQVVGGVFLVYYWNTMTKASYL